MSVTVCDYAVLNDARFDLNHPGNIHREVFERPNGFVFGQDLAQPVLFFKIKPNGSTRLIVRVGRDTPGENLPDTSERQVFSLGTGDNDDEQIRSLHWIVPGTEFGDTRTAFDFFLADGQASVAEVVLLHQVRIDSDPS